MSKTTTEIEVLLVHREEGLQRAGNRFWFDTREQAIDHIRKNARPTDLVAMTTHVIEKFDADIFRLENA